MKYSNLYLLFLLAINCSFCGTSNELPDNETTLQGINLPDGFNIEVYAENVINARGMAMGNNGTLFVGSRGEGKVYALLDTNNDNRIDEIKVIDENISKPVGLDFKNGALYVSAHFEILRYDNIEANLDNPPDPVIVYDQLPKENSHSWKYIKFGPDGKLYVPVGSPCNICDPDEEIFASIARMNADGSDLEVFAHGIRNTVGFDWHPTTGELWFTDNGRDWLGDDLPPCELNYAPQKDMHFGYPYCHGDTIADPEFGALRDCSEFVAPAQNLGPHVAPLGMKFYTGSMFPAEYQNQVFIAEHGSWNRSTPIGYRITLVKLNGNTATSYEVFADGWENEGDVSGRPVDLLILTDGSMLVSDDHGDKIYRITYGL